MLNSFITKPKKKKSYQVKKKSFKEIKEKPHNTLTLTRLESTHTAHGGGRNYLSILSRKDRAVSRSIIPYLFGRLTGSRGGNEEMSIKT